MALLAHPRPTSPAHLQRTASRNSRLVILHASELATELFDELQSLICTFAMSIIATAKLTSAVASRALYYAIKQNGV